MAKRSRAIDPRLLEVLVAPISQAPLRYDSEAQELISDQDGLAFPIRDGIPILLIDEARQIGDAPAAPAAAHESE
ncbi:MAG: Trm112 family protein [Alphaproteobacteria bacterium]|nr:Trm112 family protein [Alphaproteobacteria bacterium]